MQKIPHPQFGIQRLSVMLLKSWQKQEDPVITKSFSYLLNRQQMKKADWAIHNRHAAPGGFGFQILIRITLIVMIRKLY